MIDIDFAPQAPSPHLSVPQIDDRATLLGDLTELFLSHPYPSKIEAEQFAALACDLLPLTRADIRLLIAERLADYAFTPSCIIDTFFLLDGPEILPLLERSTCMSRMSLMKYARSCDLDPACIIAGRIDLDHGLVQCLMARDDIEVLRALARNLLAPLSPQIFRQLVTHARFDRALAKALCARARDPLLIAPLYMQATAHQRAAILRRSIEAETFSHQACPASEFERSLVEHLERAAERGEGDEVAWVLARLIGCEPLDAKDMLQDAGGDILALLLSALSACPHATQRILQVSGIGAPRSQGRTRDLMQLVSIMPSVTATRLLRIIAGQDPENTGPRGLLFQ
jgi:hypothetical protein